MLSLVILAASCACWILSYFRADIFAFTGGMIGQAVGGIVFARIPYQVTEAHAHLVLPGNGIGLIDLVNMSVFFNQNSNGYGHAGFAFIRQTDAMPNEYPNWAMIVPHWSIVAVSVIAPMAWSLCFWRNRTRNLQGLCLQCGYDLRATSDRCPECGKVVEKVI
jgi:hypothetical protein